MVTVIVPVLDEAPRIGSVLQQLRYLDLGSQGLVHEILVVDGGSRDGTLEILHSEPDIRIIEARCKGRGEAVHLGVPSARGEYVVVFPGDGEYDVESIAGVIEVLRSEPNNVVLASRTLGGTSEPAIGGDAEIGLCSDQPLGRGHCDADADGAAGQDRSDPLSGVRGARPRIFGQLDNSASGLDYDVQWVKRAVESGHRVIEIPVDYHPRSWRDGKKANVVDGIQALRAVFQLPSDDPTLFIVPAFNEETRLADLVRMVEVDLQSLRDDYELIVVDDGSQDATAQRVAETSAVLLRHERNAGKAAAVQLDWQRQKGHTSPSWTRTLNISPAT